MSGFKQLTCVGPVGSACRLTGNTGHLRVYTGHHLLLHGRETHAGGAEGRWGWGWVLLSCRVGWNKAKGSSGVYRDQRSRQLARRDRWRRGHTTDGLHQLLVLCCLLDNSLLQHLLLKLHLLNLFLEAIRCLLLLDLLHLLLDFLSFLCLSQSNSLQGSRNRGRSLSNGSGSGRRR